MINVNPPEIPKKAAVYIVAARARVDDTHADLAPLPRSEAARTAGDLILVYLR